MLLDVRHSKCALHVCTQHLLCSDEVAHGYFQQSHGWSLTQAMALLCVSRPVRASVLVGVKFSVYYTLYGVLNLSLE